MYSRTKPPLLCIEVEWAPRLTDLSDPNQEQHNFQTHTHVEFPFYKQTPSALGGRWGETIGRTSLKTSQLYPLRPATDIDMMFLHTKNHATQPSNFMH